MSRLSKEKYLKVSETMQGTLSIINIGEDAMLNKECAEFARKEVIKSLKSEVCH